MKINNTALVGFGAIGCVYARNLMKCYGDDFAVIAGGSRAEKIRKGTALNGEIIKPKVVEPKDTDWKADFIIFTVKNYQLTVLTALMIITVAVIGGIILGTTKTQAAPADISYKYYGKRFRIFY